MSKTKKRKMPVVVQRFRIAFATTFTILFLSACFSQALFQFGILPHAIQERQQAALIGRQSRRVVNMLGDILIMQLYPQYQARMLTDLKNNDAQWEQVQHAVLFGDPQLGIDPTQLPATVRQQIAQSQTSYTKLLVLIKQAEQHPPTSGTPNDPQLRALIETGTPYQMIYTKIFSDMSNDADQQVYTIQNYERLLFALQILTLFAEAFLVLRPAVRAIATAFQTIEDAINQVASSASASNSPKPSTEPEAAAEKGRQTSLLHDPAWQTRLQEQEGKRES